MLGEKGLQDLKAPGIDVAGGQGITEGAIGLSIMLAVPEPALALKRP